VIQKPSHIIISRTDSIGDVMLTLPMSGFLKSVFPEIKISFIGRSYTQAIIESCTHVDEFINWDAVSKLSSEDQIFALKKTNADVIIHVFPEKEVMTIAKKVGIKHRIATGRRWHSLSTCNHPVFFSRKKSDLHESQLNFKLLRPFGITDIPSLPIIADYSGFRAVENDLSKWDNILHSTSPKIILHTLSKGSAVNWSFAQFEQLAETCIHQGWQVIISGTAPEGERIRAESKLLQMNVHDLTGQLSLSQFISFIGKCDALVAASTGPLHIASALGIEAVGLYSPKRPIHPGRWAPIGKKANFFVAKEHPESGVLEISANAVFDFLNARITN
jgi:ADP-heptose:LPS heptosyltransferase